MTEPTMKTAPMTEIQLISHLEQMSAHRAAFLEWWTTNIEPGLPDDHISRVLSMESHWKQWKREQI